MRKRPGGLLLHSPFRQKRLPSRRVCGAVGREQPRTRVRTPACTHVYEQRRATCCGGLTAPAETPPREEGRGSASREGHPRNADVGARGINRRNGRGRREPGLLPALAWSCHLTPSSPPLVPAPPGLLHPQEPQDPTRLPPNHPRTPTTCPSPQTPGPRWSPSPPAPATHRSLPSVVHPPSPPHV